MNGSKHTPGPWQLTPRYQDKVDVIHSTKAKVPGGASLTVARVTVRESWLAEQEANARLIAAAPELLQALRDVLGWVPSGPWHTDEPMKAVERARAVIRKTGEQP